VQEMELGCIKVAAEDGIDLRSLAFVPTDATWEYMPNKCH